MNRCLMLITLLTVLGCSSDSILMSEQTDQKEYPELSPEAFSQISKCSDSWGKLLDEWEMHGGGVKVSLVETKRQIANDNESRFAKAVREVWDIMGRSHEEVSDWEWPIPSNELREVGNLLSEAVTEHVGDGCSSTSWLDPLLWNRMRFVDGDPLKFYVPQEAPDDVKWDSRSLPAWVLYWLLVPREASENSMR